jgi:hypothetical protein
MAECLLQCPITHQIFSDPVILSDGHTYERDAITTWLQTSDISPLTGALLQCKDVTSNYLVNSIIDQYTTEHPDITRYISESRLLNAIKLANIAEIRNFRDLTLTVNSLHMTIGHLGADILLLLISNNIKIYEIEFGGSLVHYICRYSTPEMIKFIGHTYERDAITTWLQTSDISPLTGALLQCKDVTSNYLVNSIIDQYTTEHPDITRYVSESRLLNAIKIADIAEIRNFRDLTLTVDSMHSTIGHLGADILMLLISNNINIRYYKPF